MAELVVMPKFGLTMREGAVVRWLVEVGDTVTRGQPLCDIETDKITTEVEAPSSGVLLRRITPIGTCPWMPGSRSRSRRTDDQGRPAVVPASRLSAAPVIERLAARNTTASATSSGVMSWRSGSVPASALAGSSTPPMPP